jgi:23S rRNA (cytosine1962-C5)-methyltransferase
VQTLPRLKLKKGKEKPLLQKHHWIYSGAVHSYPEEKGDIVIVETEQGEMLGTALLNKKGESIAAHMIAFGFTPLEEALASNIAAAIRLRALWFDPKKTNAFRLINAEGDGIPGLIVDRYADLLVVQFSHPALDSIKTQILNLLKKQMHPRSIYEKSTSSLRKKGGMEAVEGFCYGPALSEVEVIENGMKLIVPIEEGQKTGLFLDQREMRAYVQSIARNKKVLNGFGYTGAFSIAALKGGASHVDTVDTSTKAGSVFHRNLKINQLDPYPFIEEDMFAFLEGKPLDYDLIILDPPAFAKKKGDLDAAFKAYKSLNQTTIRKMKPGSILITSSCSYYIDEPLFQNILFRAALASKRSVKVIGSHRQAIDHPISIFHPESRYLKTTVLYISD